MNKSWQISRRTFLRGLGTVIALPALEAMVPPMRAIAGGAAAGSAVPKRMAFVYIPNGVNMAEWTPKAVGHNFELTGTLAPLQPFQKDLMVLSGLAHDKAKPNGDGGGDHARASTSFLTGCQARKTDGADIRAGVSVDQIAAEKLGAETRFASLELGCDRGQQVGNCDSGYSCAYSFNVSWKTESTPLPPEIDPRAAFDRLFSNGADPEAREGQFKRDLYHKSILDFALDDANRLKGKLGYTDRRKLDEYLSAVRDIERRIENVERFAGDPTAFARPKGIPGDFEEHVRLMADMMVLAFQTDSTRVSTFIMAHDGSNRSYPSIDVPEGHHELSHHGNNEEKKQKIARIDQFHARQFAYLLEKMKSVREGEGTLLDSTMIVYGGGISDGNRHNHNDLPIILAGKAGGTLNTGRHLRYADDTPMTNLYLAMLERMGVPAERVGDSTGKLDNLA